MTRVWASLQWGFAIVVLLASLAVVTWRQSRALEVLERVDRQHRQISVLQADSAGLQHTIQALESRAYIVPAARQRLGMHTPDASELVILPESAAQ